MCLSVPSALVVPGHNAGAETAPPVWHRCPLPACFNAEMNIAVRVFVSRNHSTSRFDVAFEHVIAKTVYSTLVGRTWLTIAGKR